MIFDFIEEFYDEWRKSSVALTAILTLATTIGLIYSIIKLLSLLYQLIQGARLYILSQFCCSTNYIKRYGKWVVISGATDGIGLAMAKELARRGHSLIILGRNDEKLSRSKEALESEQNVGQVVAIKIDLADSSIENFERIRDLIDPDGRDIGILINNAGTFVPKFMRFNRFQMDNYKTIVNVNVLAPVYLTRLIMPSMIARRRGLIVNVSSMSGCLPAPYMSVYGPSKSFLNAFSRSLQVEYSKHPIDIINLTPGGVKTNIFAMNKERVSSSSPFVVEADYYAKVAINAFATRINSFSGTIIHGITLRAFESFKSISLILFKLAIGSRKDVSDLSPVLGRRKRSVTELSISNFDRDEAIQAVQIENHDFRVESVAGS